MSVRYTLKGWLADNTVTVSDTRDKILVLEPVGRLDDDQIIEEMLRELTGLKRETLKHAVELYHRIIGDRLARGFSVSTASFHAAPIFHGTISDGVWNPERNSIGVSMRATKQLREKVACSAVEILGEKPKSIQIYQVKDLMTGATDGTATRGKSLLVKGKNIKVIGDNERVGIWFTGADEVSTKVPEYDINYNMPSELNFTVPTSLPVGTYTMTITTQYSKSARLLKVPHTIETPIEVI